MEKQKEQPNIKLLTWTTFQIEIAKIAKIRSYNYTGTHLK